MTEASPGLNNLRQLIVKRKCEQHQNDVTVNTSNKKKTKKTVNTSLDSQTDCFQFTSLENQMAECTVKNIKKLFSKGSLDNQHRIHFKYKDRPCPEFKFNGKRQCR